MEIETGNIIKVQESYLEVTGINLVEYGIIEAVPLNFPDHKEMRIQLASIELVWKINPQSKDGKLPIPHVSGSSIPEPPKRPLCRVMREGVGHFCTNCGSTMPKSGFLMLFGKRYCDNDKCPNSKPKKNYR